MQARASLLSPRAVCALALSVILLGGCVTSTGGDLQFINMKDPAVQQRTDLFLQSFEEGCLAQRFDEMVTRKLSNGFANNLAYGKWPLKPVSMPMRYGSRANPRQAAIAEWNYWEASAAGDIGKNANFGWRLRGSLLKGLPEFYQCDVKMIDVDIDRIAAALGERTGALGVTYDSWQLESTRKKEESRYFTHSLDIPVMLQMQALSKAIHKPFFNGREPIGFGENDVLVKLVIGVPNRNFPPGTVGDLLRNTNALATPEMRRDVALYTTRLQGALTADFNTRRQAHADHLADVARREREFLAEYYKDRKSDAEVFADAMNQSANNMRRQQQAFDRIDRQVGGATTSQQRLNAAREAGRNGIIPGGSSGSGGSSSTSGSGGSGGSGSASSGGGLALCASTYVDPPAKYRDQMMTLSWGCNSRYKSAAEVNAVYSQWVDGIEKRDAAAQAAKDRQAALRKANRVDAPPAKNPCPENSGTCSVGKQ